MMQAGSFDHLLTVAHEEMATAQGELPEALQAGARSVPVTFEPSPNTGFAADGIAPDTLGLFLGESLADGPSSHPQPTQIILFLENLWEFAGTDEVAYREEIRITYLHELGHYFGMDEDDLEARGLD